MVQFLRRWNGAAAVHGLMGALLAAAWLAPGSPIVERLKGSGRLGDELRTARRAGYYESLIEPGAAVAGRGKVAPEGHVPFRRAGLGVRDESAYFLTRLVPDLEAEWNGTRVTTNSLGLRNPEIAVPKPSGTYRVVVLGSSNTFGHGVDDDEVYVRLLEPWLDAATPGVKVEVVNLAVPGESPSQKLYRLTGGEVERLEPDWILIDATAIDVWLEQGHLVNVANAGRESPYPFLAEIVRRAGVGRDDTLDDAVEKLDPFGPAILDGIYDGWASEGRRLDVPLAVVLLPRADTDAASPNLFRMIRRAAGRNGLALFDLSTAFDGMELDDYRIGAWDKHPTAEGHRAIFEALRGEIVDEGGAPR